MDNDRIQTIHSTTVVGLIKNGKAVIGSDGQVTFGNTILKHTAKKIRKLYNGMVLAGFAGGTADAFALLQRFEEKLETTRGNLYRSVLEFARDWRTDRYLRRLEAMMIVMNKEKLFVLTGNGDVVEPDDNLAAIGSGGPFALASARALLHNTNLEPRQIVEISLKIASEICIYTNSEFTIEEI